MRLMVMKDFKRVGVGVGVFSGGSAVTWSVHPGETQFKVMVASAVVALVLLAADGVARLGIYLLTALVELGLEAFTTVSAQKAADREAAEDHLDRQLARALTLSGREPPDGEEVELVRVVPGLVGSAWENAPDEEEQQRDRAE
jgi:hypothetical protein